MAFPNPNLYTCTYTHTLTRTYTMHTLACIYRHKFLGKNVYKLCEKTHEINQQWLPLLVATDRVSKCWMFSLNCNM